MNDKDCSKEIEKIESWIHALASRTGQRFVHILERLNELDKKGTIFPSEENDIKNKK